MNPKNIRETGCVKLNWRHKRAVIKFREPKSRLYVLKFNFFAPSGSLFAVCGVVTSMRTTHAVVTLSGGKRPPQYVMEWAVQE